MDTDYAIIEAGVVGLSVDWDLLKRGITVTVIDGDDGSFRASRGNFGLVCVQPKGMQPPRYARWSEVSAKAWADFAAELGDATGYNLGQEQKGGYDLHFSEDTLYSTVARYEALKSRLDGNYPFELLGHNALRLEEPHIGPTVVGAILHHQDGHANPLQLLKALSGNVRRLGGLMLTGKRVTDVTKPNGFQVHCADGTLIESVGRVLSAGPGPWSWGRSLASRHLSGHSACKC